MAAESLTIPSRKSEVMLTAAWWLDEEQASECPKQKHGWQPSGFPCCKLKKPGLHLLTHTHTRTHVHACLAWKYLNAYHFSGRCSVKEEAAKWESPAKTLRADLQTLAYGWEKNTVITAVALDRRRACTTIHEMSERKVNKLGAKDYSIVCRSDFISVILHSWGNR